MTQHQTDDEAGPQVRGYLDDGLRAGDAVSAALAASDGAPMLQVHAVAESRAVHHGAGLRSQCDRARRYRTEASAAWD